MKFNVLLLLIIGFIVSSLLSCSSSKYTISTYYEDANEFVKRTKNSYKKPLLNVYLKDNNVYSFRDMWEIDTLSKQITGYGDIVNEKDIDVSDVEYMALLCQLDSVEQFEVYNYKKELKSTFVSLYTNKKDFIKHTCKTEYKYILEVRLEKGNTYDYGTSWSIDSLGNNLIGIGYIYDDKEQEIYYGMLSNNMSDIVSYEVYKYENGSKLFSIVSIVISLVLVFITVVWAAINKVLMSF